jgi:rRNA maturation endonuclease Nob1
VEEQLKRLLSGERQPSREGKRLLKDYQIECEECDETSYVASYQEPTHCPMCGSKTEAEEVQSMDKNK